MAYIIDIAESLHLTKHQRKQVQQILQQRATDTVVSHPPTRQHRTASTFHGRITARFAGLATAKDALEDR